TRTTSRAPPSYRRTGCVASPASASSEAAPRRWTRSSRSRSGRRSSPHRLTAMARALVAVVGRPNVGKSTLFNRLIGDRVAIVEDEPGTTRDRLYATTEWRGREFTLVDTGGLVDPGGPRSPREPPQDLEDSVRRQAEAAIDEADVVLFVVDAQAGIIPVEHDVADRLRRSRKPVVLAANKTDSWRSEAQAAEFYSLGL